MKHSKLILFILTAMSLTTCTSPDEYPEKLELQELNTMKHYYTVNPDVTEEALSSTILEKEDEHKQN